LRTLFAQRIASAVDKFAHKCFRAIFREALGEGSDQELDICIQLYRVERACIRLLKDGVVQGLDVGTECATHILSPQNS